VAFIQRIQPPGACQAGHGDCCVIDCVTTDPVRHHETGHVIHQAGAVVWQSHMTAAIHPEHVVVLLNTPDKHDGQGIRVTRYGSWVADLGFVAELEQFFPLAVLEERRLNAGRR
jgi:hypothetical protein